jgi:hypothetical protein
MYVYIYVETYIFIYLNGIHAEALSQQIDMHKTRSIEMQTSGIEATSASSNDIPAANIGISTDNNGISKTNNGISTDNNGISTVKNDVLTDNNIELTRNNDLEIDQSAGPVTLSVTYVYDCEANEEIRALETLKVGTHAHTHTHTYANTHKASASI